MSPGRLLYLARFYAARGPRYWYAEQHLARRIIGRDLTRSLPEHPETVPVHLLTSKYDWIMALWMLASFHHFTRRRWSITVHDDGSLPTEAHQAFAKNFPGSKIISRTEADRAMAEVLGDFPRCADYRSRMPHGLKCFDIPFFAQHDRFILLDPDVLFFAEPRKILSWVEDPGDNSCWLNKDFQEPSPIPPSTVKADLGINLWPQVNSGLCLLSRETVTDLASMDLWLAHPLLSPPNPQWRVEQTLIALSTSRANQGGLLPDSFEVSPDKKRGANCVARHYIGCVRDRFYSEGIFALSSLAN